MIRFPLRSARFSLAGSTSGVLAVLFLVVGCESSIEPTLTTWEGNLAPVFPSTVAGQVAAVSQFGRTQASIQIMEADPEVTYGWRINSGTCEQEGLIRGGVAAYEPLYPGDLGSDEASAVLGVVFRDGETLAARVYRPDGDSGETVVACGELEQTR